MAVLCWNQGTLDRYHAESGLNRMASADKVPPTLALTTFVLGPMRSLAVDVLWWRAIQQQDAGRFYDAMQLADWITKLQPTYSSVWVFHGWNMSFNISADFATALLVPDLPSPAIVVTTFCFAFRFSGAE